MDEKELKQVQDDLVIDDQLKSLILNDDKLKDYIKTSLFNTEYNKHSSQLHLDAYATIRKKILTDDRTNTFLEENLKDTLSNDIIDHTLYDYENMQLYEGKGVLYSLSRLLYLQNKYKDDEIGKRIDEQIKNDIDLIKGYDETKDLTKDPNGENILLLQYFYVSLAYITQSNVFFDIRPMFNFTELNHINDNTDLEHYKQVIINRIENNIKNSTTYYRLNEKLTNCFNDIENNIDNNNFYKVKNKELKEIMQKYGVTEDKDGTIHVQQDKEDAFFREYKEIYRDYFKTDGINLYGKDDTDKWLKKIDDLLAELKQLLLDNKIELNDITFSYLIDKIAYNDYQKATYNIKDRTKTKRHKLTKEELKEKYKDSTLLDDNTTLDYDRKWAKLDTSKVNSNIFNLRESIGKNVENNTYLTLKRIDELEKIPKRNKQQSEELKDLEEKLKEQQEARQDIQEQIEDLQADIKLIESQLTDIQDANQIKKLSRERNKKQKQLDELKEIINNKGITMQLDINGNLTYEKQKNKGKKKEDYKLMIPQDYNLQNWSIEGRNFLYYVPNIPNITSLLDEDFIPIDIMDFLDFTGRPTGNVSRIRRSLQNSLKEMRKESYDYSFYDEKGALQEGSLVLIGDIKGTEYKGKATVKVQLGATFKQNLKQAIIKGQLVKINKQVFKIGKGRNDKAEKMAKEIFLYLSRLCRTEAKKGTINGQWLKDMHLDTIITYLAEINLLDYDLNNYNKKVKEPLLYALNTGMNLGLFTYKTKAFEYYDDVISAKNNGRSVKDKIDNFENGKDYGIRFILNSDMIDLDTNQKAHNTYKKYQEKNSKKATKK